MRSLYRRKVIRIGGERFFERHAQNAIASRTMAKRLDQIFARIEIAGPVRSWRTFWSPIRSLIHGTPITPYC